MMGQGEPLGMLGSGTHQGTQQGDGLTLITQPQLGNPSNSRFRHLTQQLISGSPVMKPNI